METMYRAAAGAWRLDHPSRLANSNAPTTPTAIPIAVLDRSSTRLKRSTFWKSAVRPSASGRAP
jgi:hypothetical protein